MSSELYTNAGKRKYLTAEETARFITAAKAQERPEVRTFALVLAYTGCRISEALELTPSRLDFSARAITLRTLKQRRQDVYRSVPVPDELLDTLELVHGVRKALRGRKGQSNLRLWTWGRAMASRHVTTIMDAAGISGAHASAKGLRHGFGVKAAAETKNPRMVQKWLGHRSLETTVIYMDALGDEERELAARMWD